MGIDLILLPGGSLVFLEINPRLQSSTHVLDILIRDEWNPILMQFKTFCQPGFELETESQFDSKNSERFHAHCL